MHKGEGVMVPILITFGTIGRESSVIAHVVANSLNSRPWRDKFDFYDEFDLPPGRQVDMIENKKSY
jgi:hypothetical protein